MKILPPTHPTGIFPNDKYIIIYHKHDDVFRAVEGATSPEAAKKACDILENQDKKAYLNRKYSWITRKEWEASKV